MQYPTITFIFGILGNIVSFLVYLAPAPTFYKISKKKSTEGFQCLPYVVALLSSMLWIYYATLKSNEILLVTINSIGCFVETIYISIYLVFASKKSRITAEKLIVLLIVVGFGSILSFTIFFIRGPERVQILGWICVALSTSVYVAPLTIMKQVISTKSVEFMPISLSFALVLNAVIWFFYGLLLKDFYIAGPNTVGFIFGLLQIVLYFIYKNSKGDYGEEDNLPTTIKLETTTDQILGTTIMIEVQNDGESVEKPKEGSADGHQPN